MREESQVHLLCILTGPYVHGAVWSP